MAYLWSNGSDGGSDDVGQNFTIIQRIAPGNVDASMAGRGIIRLIRYWCAGVGNAKIKVFRDDGTNYVFLGEIAIITAVGENNFPAWIPVEKEDYLAFYHNTVYSILRYQAGNVGDNRYRAGDIMITTPKAEWSSGGARLSMKARIHSRAILL